MDILEYLVREFEEQEDKVSTVCDKLSRATGLDEIAAPAFIPLRFNTKH